MPKEKKRKHDRDEDPHEREKRKAAKRAEKVAKMLGYSNDTNPFGDSNLLAPFVWGKKMEKDKREGRNDDVDSEGKRMYLMDEIKRVRSRREEREAELEEMERLRSEEQRLREAAQFGDWQEKEEEFHTEQTRVRSKIRLNEKREQPIDTLAKNILLVEAAKDHDRGKVSDGVEISLETLDVELRDPVELIEDLTLPEIEKLVDDIEGYIQLYHKSKIDEHEQFWRSLKVIAASMRRKLGRREEGAIHKSLMKDVEDMLRGKDDSALDALQHDIRKRLSEGKCADVSYWEEIEREVTVQRAKSLVVKTHRNLLRVQLDLLSRLRSEAHSAMKRPAGDFGQGDSALDDAGEGRGFRASSSSGGSGTGTGDPASSEELAMLRNEQEKGLEESEERMRAQDEIFLPGETYWWQDKYRPRKPRYFNRVRTGWDWNKYNQTHYDHDNPPPKTIQGYKFAMFYPDLIDKTVTPKYFLEVADSPEFAILRFHAGPPYEDIAFKIVNKQWDINRKSGFRCVFERGLLQLNFNFKRDWYRR